MPTGVQLLLDILVDAGVTRLFGNPGTTELPLVDALALDGRIEYLLGLHEIPVMAMADGYAQASRSLAVTNLHASCGLGNAMGMLYNLHRAGTPVLVTAGQSDRRLQLEEPILWSNLAEVARPWTKWSHEVRRVEDLPTVLRRAIQTALTPPTGPVFLALPIDVLMEPTDVRPEPWTPLDTRVRPPAEAVDRAARLLAKARRPAILAGSRLVEAGAIEAIVALAERLGAPAFTESATTHGRLGFPATHALYGQTLPLWSPEVRARLAEFDVVVAAGLDLLRQYLYFEPARALPEATQLIHLDEDAWQIGKNYPATVGVLGHVRASLNELVARLDALQGPAERAAAQERRREWEARHAADRAALVSAIAEERTLRPATPRAVMGALAGVLPDDVAVVEEAVTTTQHVFERLGALRDPSGYFGHRGWALGWGIGCALGVKLAWPDRPVLALVGEGSTMYGVQGLWTAARYRIPVTFVVTNNRQYQILKGGARHLGLPAAMAGRFVGMDLVGPEIDFVGLARALGVEARRVEDPDELASEVARSLAGGVPRVLEIPLASGPSEFG